MQTDVADVLLPSPSQMRVSTVLSCFIILPVTDESTQNAVELAKEYDVIRDPLWDHVTNFAKQHHTATMASPQRETYTSAGRRQEYFGFIIVAVANTKYIEV